jgi:hypothetical protein
VVSDHLARYLAQAERCEILAAASISSMHRDSYLRLAEEWRTLARECSRELGAASIPSLSLLKRPDESE